VVSIDANDHRSAVVATRAAVAEWLGVEPDAFDVDAYGPEEGGSSKDGPT
jgi:hypothetical protein